MKVKLLDLVLSQKPLMYLSKQPIPARSSFLLARVLQECERELRAYETARVQLCEKHGVPANGQADLNGKEDFVKELDELLDTTADLKAERIKLSAIEKAEIPAADTAQLIWLIDTEQDSP